MRWYILLFSGPVAYDLSWTITDSHPYRNEGTWLWDPTLEFGIPQHSTGSLIGEALHNSQVGGLPPSPSGHAGRAWGDEVPPVRQYISCWHWFDSGFVSARWVLH